MRHAQLKHEELYREDIELLDGINLEWKESYTEEKDVPLSQKLNPLRDLNNVYEFKVEESNEIIRNLAEGLIELEEELNAENIDYMRRKDNLGKSEAEAQVKGPTVIYDSRINMLAVYDEENKIDIQIEYIESEIEEGRRTPARIDVLFKCFEGKYEDEEYAKKDFKTIDKFINSEEFLSS